jgi:hypothetical protein
MAGQIRRLTSQHRIFVLQCAQTISHERKVFVRGVGALASAEPHKRGRIHGWHPPLAGDKLITLSGEAEARIVLVCQLRAGAR